MRKSPHPVNAGAEILSGDLHWEEFPHDLRIVTYIGRSCLMICVQWLTLGGVSSWFAYSACSSEWSGDFSTPWSCSSAEFLSSPADPRQHSCWSAYSTTSLATIPKICIKYSKTETTLILIYIFQNGYLNTKNGVTVNNQNGIFWNIIYSELVSRSIKLCHA